jgi:hypothetical protein
MQEMVLTNKHHQNQEIKTLQVCYRKQIEQQVGQREMWLRTVKRKVPYSRWALAGRHRLV